MDGPFRRAGDMVDFFSRLIGPFPYDRLSHVQSTTMFGGVENPTAIFYDDNGLSAAGRLRELTVAHETAHQWFGDAVTEGDWHHLWLSEGFATYFAALWLRHADGDSAFRAEMRAAGERSSGPDATSRPILDTDATDLMGLLNSNNYPKGAWVLHSLRGLIGDSAFQAGIRDWYATYRDSTALSSDFARIMGAGGGTGSGVVLPSGADAARLSQAGPVLAAQGEAPRAPRPAGPARGVGGLSVAAPGARDRWHARTHRYRGSRDDDYPG